jgi:transcriptional regulator with XRE-family HTH domain
MAKKSTKPAANHLRAWREFREMSQDELGKLVNTKGNVIGLLEAGERSLSDKWLRRLAPALGTRAGWLLEYDPNDLDSEMLEAAAEVPADKRRQAIDILRTFKTG